MNFVYISRALYSLLLSVWQFYMFVFFFYLWLTLFFFIFLILQDIYWQFLSFIVFIMFFFARFLFLGNIFLIFRFRLRYLLFLREYPYFILKSCFIYFLLFFLCLVYLSITVSRFLSLSLPPPHTPSIINLLLLSLPLRNLPLHNYLILILFYFISC